MSRILIGSGGLARTRAIEHLSENRISSINGLGRSCLCSRFRSCAARGLVRSCAIRNRLNTPVPGVNSVILEIDRCFQGERDTD